MPAPGGGRSPRCGWRWGRRGCAGAGLARPVACRSGKGLRLAAPGARARGPGAAVGASRAGRAGPESVLRPGALGMARCRGAPALPTPREGARSWPSSGGGRGRDVAQARASCACVFRVTLYSFLSDWLFLSRSHYLVTPLGLRLTLEGPVRPARGARDMPISLRASQADERRPCSESTRRIWGRWK